ncbi:MAG: hypothetical protein JSW50_08220 [Candidatus Latescibacterota bacterium]|nr:MAG: hypothetical protein JSW50_08220 [Candidatus Latescibacterota bacterium]
MKASVVILCVCVIAASTPSPVMAGAGIGIGPKIGYADYKGDVLPSSGDVGMTTYYGMILDITTLPVIGFEFHANYVSRNFEYTYSYAGVDYTTDFEFQDVFVNVIVKKNLIRQLASPIALYIGAGPGWHLLNTEVVMEAVGDGLDPSIELTLDPSMVDNPVVLMKNAVKMSADVMAGLKISLPSMPLAVYGETRYGIVFTEESLRSFQVEAGAMLSF